MAFLSSGPVYSASVHIIHRMHLADNPLRHAVAVAAGRVGTSLARCREHIPLRGIIA